MPGSPPKQLAVWPLHTYRVAASPYALGGAAERAKNEASHVSRNGSMYVENPLEAVCIQMIFRISDDVFFSILGLVMLSARVVGSTGCI